MPFCRWGFTPLDDARRFNHDRVADILVNAMGPDGVSADVNRDCVAMGSGVMNTDFGTGHGADKPAGSVGSQESINTDH